MGASRPTDARKAAAIPVWPETQNLFVGAGFIPPGEPCAVAGSGGMRASRPTDARVGCGCPVSRVMFGRFVGAGFIPPGEPCAAAGCGGMGASRPTAALVGCGCPVSRVMFGRFVGEGHAPPAGPCRTANIHGRAMALPYEPAQMPPPSGWCETQNLFVGADSISARGLAATQGSRDDLRPKSRACGPVGLRNAPAGAVRASSPTRVCYNVKFAVSRFTAAFAVGRRGGFHIRPGVFAAPQTGPISPA